MAIFGLDVGEKRIGVASVDPETKIVKPERAFTMEELPDLVKYLQSDTSDTLVIVGMPTNQRGELTAQSGRVQDFAAQLKTVLPVTAKINFFGESATTKLALERLRAQGFDDVALRGARAMGLVDVEAAVIILEGWAEENL